MSRIPDTKARHNDQMLHIEITYKEYRIPKPSFLVFFKTKPVLRLPFRGAGPPSTLIVQQPTKPHAVKPRQTSKPVSEHRFPAPAAYIPDDPVKHIDHVRFDKCLEGIHFDLKSVEKAATLLSVILTDAIARYPNHFVPPDERLLLETLKGDSAVYELLKDCHQKRDYKRVRRLRVFSRPPTPLSKLQHLGFDGGLRPVKFNKRKRRGGYCSVSGHSPSISSPLAKSNSDGDWLETDPDVVL